MTKQEFIAWLMDQPETRNRYFRETESIRPMVPVADMEVLRARFTAGDIQFETLVEQTLDKKSFVVNWDQKTLRVNVFESIGELIAKEIARKHNLKGINLKLTTALNEIAHQLIISHKNQDANITG